jgi:subtilase family serine protease
LVTSPNAETLGVQGFPQMMADEDYVIQHHLATVISQSFAATEQSFGSTASLMNLRYAFMDAETNGVTILGASGDGGVANAMKEPVKNPVTVPYPTVNWPASDPLVTGVGGTYLCTDPQATTDEARTITAGQPAKCGVFPTQSEIGWTGSGGGFSSIFATPDYQSGVSGIGTMRGVPDVAFQASSGTGALVYDSLPPDGSASNVNCPGGPCSAGWYDIGGTSLATPQWAGLVAIADQLNQGGLGLINPALYDIASSSRYSSDFYDVTTGNNSNLGITGYPAGPGWDPVTGIGTPNAANLVPDLVNPPH